MALFLQMRSLGGAVGSSLVGTIMEQNVVWFSATANLTEEQVNILRVAPTLIESTTSFDSAQLLQIRILFNEIFSTAFKMAAGATALGILTLIGCYESGRWIRGGRKGNQPAE
jgi:hypothetical protein